MFTSSLSKRCFVLAASLTLGVAAQATDLVLTESSSDSLTATFGTSSLTVIKDSPDHWHIDSAFTDPLALIGFSSRAWREPSGETGYNLMTGNVIVDTTGNLIHIFFRLSIVSDSTVLPENIPLADNNATFTLLGTQNTITFKDLGDTTGTVPEACSTLSLLAAAVGTLFALRANRGR